MALFGFGKKEIIEPTRRGFLLGVAGVIAAPAVVKISSLMPVKSAPLHIAYDIGLNDSTVIGTYKNGPLTIDMITREAVSLFKNSNAFIQQLDSRYPNAFAVANQKIETELRIRLPNKEVYYAR